MKDSSGSGTRCGCVIPVDVGMLIHDRLVNPERIEYVSNWDPDVVAHTICAFANDYENIDGGYIVIGVKEDCGIPVDFSNQSPEDIVMNQRNYMDESDTIGRTRSHHLASISSDFCARRKVEKGV